MLNFLTLQRFLQFARMFLDITIMSLLLYYCIKIVRNNSRTIQIFKGILFVVFINVAAKAIGLETVAWVAEMFMNWGFLAVIIIFQPEIRGLLEKLGKSSVFSRISTLSGDERENLVEQLVKATMALSAESRGALITLEQSQSLSDYIKTGTPMNSVVTSELLTSIFVTSTPLHDGAVIIQGDKIACASAYFPPTALDLPTRYGARHRAALGISEITDSITIVVSEETGSVSIAQEGKLTTMTETKLREFLMKIICNQEIEVASTAKQKVITEDVVHPRVASIEKEILEQKKQQQKEVSPDEKVKREKLLNLFKKKEDPTVNQRVVKVRNEQQTDSQAVGYQTYVKKDGQSQPLSGEQNKPASNGTTVNGSTDAKKRGDE